MAVLRRTFLHRAAFGLAALAAAGPAEAATHARRRHVAAPAIQPNHRTQEPRVVAIDAGHGGRDPGAIGVRGTYEKHITIRVARDLARRLDGSGRYKVVMTRQSDAYIPLTDRVRLARAGQSALFVSLHADSVPHPDARGFSVYTLSDKASDALTAALAQRENAVDNLQGLEFLKQPRPVRTILLDLLQRETRNNSALMAQTVVETLAAELHPLDHPHRSANFAVLRAPDVPSILVEMGFLSNPKDEALLNRQSYQTDVAQRMVVAIDEFFAHPKA